MALGATGGDTDGGGGGSGILFAGPRRTVRKFSSLVGGASHKRQVRRLALNEPPSDN